MRFIIYGAGAVGGVLGGYLSRAGEEVVLIGRPHHVRVINERGLKIISPVETFTVKVPAVASPAEIDFTPDDVVFLAVKGQDTFAALSELKKAVMEAPLFCFQNGVRNEEIALDFYPRVYPVLVRTYSAYIKDGEVWVKNDPPAWYAVGRYPEGADRLCDEAADVLRRAGFLSKVVPDVMTYKWGKLVLNLENAVQAITGESREVFQKISRAVNEEASAVLAKAGVRWALPEALGETWPEVKSPWKKTWNYDAMDSTWQSLERATGSIETDFLNGEIVRVAHENGLEAPLNEKLVSICDGMAANREKPGKHPVPELEKMLGLS